MSEEIVSEDESDPGENAESDPDGDAFETTGTIAGFSRSATGGRSLSDESLLSWLGFFLQQRRVGNGDDFAALGVQYRGLPERLVTPEFRLDLYISRLRAEADAQAAEEWPDLPVHLEGQVGQTLSLIDAMQLFPAEGSGGSLMSTTSILPMHERVSGH